MAARLRVLLRGDHCGTLERDGTSNQFTFQYEPSWIAAHPKELLSFSLPVGQEEFGYEDCLPFFRGLLPEGLRRERIARGRRIDSADDFALLEAIGGDCAGAVSVVEEFVQDDPAGVELVDEHDLIESLRNYTDTSREPSKPPRGRRRYSLAGVQVKDVLYFKPGEDPATAPLKRPTGSMPSTHIVKPALNPEYLKIAWNEALCMRLADSLRLPVKVPVVRIIDGVECFIVARYDRAFDSEGRVTRIHQEDFCQALKALHKYEYDDQENKVGPGFAEILSVARKLSEPVRAIPLLHQAAIFNLLIANADAHAKNLSIFHLAGGRAELAPFYDLVCTAHYPDLAREMGMGFGKQLDPEHLTESDFKSYCSDTRINMRAFRHHVENMCKVVINAAEDLRREINGDAGGIGHNVIGHIRRRVHILSEIFKLGINANAEPDMDQSPAWRMPGMS